jgi:hypothetical protein
MNTLELLKQAITCKQQISFQYNKAGKIVGERIGNPHAVFIFTAKNTNLQSTKVHIVQTDGVSDTKGEKPFPSFRMYNIEELSEVKILTGRLSFTPSLEEGYNPEWEGYKDVIAKV